MISIGGFGFLLAAVFGGYVLAGGKLDIILHAMPFEGLMIGGAAIGSFIMANSLREVKHTLSGFGKVLKGARYQKADYVAMAPWRSKHTSKSRQTPPSSSTSRRSARIGTRCC
jgi:chemotaxis protein MotA